MAKKTEAAQRRRDAWLRDLERPRRYIVRAVEFGGHSVREMHADNPRDAVGTTGGRAALMGTHETLRHAADRLGWE